MADVVARSGQIRAEALAKATPAKHFAKDAECEWQADSDVNLNSELRSFVHPDSWCESLSVTDIEMSYIVCNSL